MTEDVLRLNCAVYFYRKRTINMRILTHSGKTCSSQRESGRTDRHVNARTMSCLSPAKPSLITDKSF